jgi:hypothetical protein
MYAWSGSAWSAVSTANGAVTTGTLAQFAATTSSQLAGVISDETGSGALVFGTAPTLTGGLAAADPTASLGLATKQYVDLVTAGVNYHAPVIAASVSNLSSNYNNGTSGVGATLTADTNRAFSTLDGQTVSVGQRILIKDQTAQLQNGIYTLTTVGSGAAPWVITRATDNDAAPELANGDVVNITGGTVNSGKTFVNSTTGTITVGTTAITFASYYTGLPSQTGSSGLYLTTDGTTPSWSAATDATKAPLASPTFTGTVTIPTGAVITAPKIACTYTAKTAAYTFASGDEGNIFSMNNAATQQFNIPTDATFNFAVGTEFTVFWITGAGQPTIGATTPGTTTVISTGATSATPKLRVANSGATCKKIAANSWIVFGDLA